MSAEVRQQAVDPAGSFLVQAPAGSGKTELLTRRILTLLAVVDDPEEILALTFTRKAAAEMRGRVIDALTMPKPDDPDSHKMETWQLAQLANRRSDERGWHLSEHPMRLKMMTLDSFTHALAARMPLLSGLGEMPTPSTHVLPLYREAAEMAVRRLIREQPDKAAAVLLHQDHNLVALINLVADMLGKRDQWWVQVVSHADDMDELRVEQEQMLGSVMQQKIEHCADMIPTDIKSGMPALLRFAGEHLDDALLTAIDRWPDATVEELSIWQRIADMLLVASKPQFRKSATKAVGFPPGKGFAEQKQQFVAMLETLVAGHDGLAAALHELRLLPTRAEYDDAQWQVLEGLFSLLIEAGDRLHRLFVQRGEADFIEIALRAMQALEDEHGNPTDLLLRLDYRIHHILVDEFQDTSILQMRLLRNLTEGWQGSDGVHRTLFMVGDPMQSIYRFRKAEVSLFMLAALNRAGLPNVEALQLERNFRSSPVIVQWVNRAFAHIFPDEPDILMAAVDHAVAQAALEHDGAVNLHLRQGRDDTADAAAVVELVRRELNDASKRIALLSRSRKHLHAIMHALADAGIAFSAVDILPLNRQPEIRLLRAVLRALLHPADRESWAALLRSPCCGLSASDLYQLMAGDERPLFTILNDAAQSERLDVDVRARAGFVVEALSPCLSSAGRTPLRPLLQLAMRRLGLFDAFGRDAETNIDAMLDLVEELDEGGLVDFSLLDERLEKLYAAPDSSPEARRVELLTMHGAKGLQWDVVILPGLGHGSGRSDSPLVAFSDIPVSGAMHPLVAAKGAVRSSDAVYSLVQNVEKEKENNELSRLLYVACTRAETALHMFGHVSEVSGEAASGSLLNLLLPDGVESGCFGANVTIMEGEETNESVVRMPLQRVRSLPMLEAADEPVSEGDESEYFWAGPEAAPVGNVVHAALQHVAETGVEQWSKMQTCDEIARIRSMLLAEGLSGAMLEDAGKRARAALEKVLESDRGRWLLSSAHHDAHCEWELSGMQDGFIAHHVIDRSFIDENRIRWIIDYKTAGHEGGGLDAFLAEEARRHAVQLKRYAEVVRALEPEREIRCALYFPMLDAWREVEIEWSEATCTT